MIDCLYLKDDGCEVIKNLLGEENKKCGWIIPHHTACEACSKDKYNPQAENIVTVNLAFSQCKDCSGCDDTVLREKNNENLSKYNLDFKPKPMSIEELGDGPGTELHKIFSRAGFTITEACDCVKIIKLMNQWGPDVCKDEIDSIIGMLRKSAVLYSWTTSIAIKVTPDIILRKMINRAIANYERTHNGD